MMILWTYLVINTLVEQNTQRPPVGPDVVAFTSVHLWCEVCQCARLAGEDLAGNDI